MVFDDASWAPILARIKTGEFQAVYLQLDGGTYGGSLRSAERPQGVKEVKPEEKEQVRAANELSHRGLQVAAAALPRRIAWWVAGPACTPGPFDLPAWKLWLGRHPDVLIADHGLGDLHADGMQYEVHPIFNLKMPKSCPGVDSAILDPRNSWEDRAAYDAAAEKLRDMFRANFEETGFAALGIEPAM